MTSPTLRGLLDGHAGRRRAPEDSIELPNRAGGSPIDAGLECGGRFLPPGESPGKRA